MKVLLYFDKPEKIKKSGIGRALKHQCAALESAGISYTFNPKDTYDLAHINTYWPASKKVFKKVKKNHIPIIMHGHSTIEDFKNSFKCWKIIAKCWYNPNLMWFYKNGDYIITPTAYSKKCIDNYNLGTPVTHISNGINPKEYEYNENYIKAFKEKFNITDEPVVMGVGFPFNRKGIKDFFAIAKERPDIKFFWFGYLSKFLMTNDVKRAIKHKPNNVIMPGYIDNSIIKGCYRYAKCMLFPTYEETEGIVALEALASECSLLVRNIGVYEDWLTDGVNCYKANNNEEFLNKLDYILTNDNKQIIANGLKVVNSITLENIGQQLKQTYEEVLNKYKEKENAK